ncbi:MAG: exodeoxyribonuclease VII small subunit [Acidobacteriota bacterium]
MAKKKTEQFEESLAKLQTIVEKLERGDLPLEEAMESFAEGVRLAQFCHHKLEEAESRVQVLLQDKNEGGWTTAPLDPCEKDCSED